MLLHPLTIFEMNLDIKINLDLMISRHFYFLVTNTKINDEITLKHF